MESCIQFSLQQKIFFNLVFILLTIAGCFALTVIPTERYPDINMAVVNITTDYPGASALDVETLVTRKIEEAIEDIENVEWIAASSQPERSYIRIKLVDDVDYEDLYDEIRFHVLNAKDELPVEAEQPEIENVTMGVLLPVVIVNLSGEHDNHALKLMSDELRSQFRKISGVKKVVRSGDLVREFHILLDPEKMRLLGVSFDEIATALQQQNVSITAGSYKHQDLEYLLQVDEKFFDQQSVRQAVIRRDGDGNFIRLSDLVTRVDFDYRNPSVISTINGKNAIALRVIKLEEGSALAIKDEVSRIIDQFKPLLQKEQINITLTQDASIKINDGLSTLGWNLIVGMILVSLSSWFFMGGRNAGLITIGIPFSFLVTVLIMHVTGYSFNEITLFAFVLVSGIIVDDAIVVTENIYRYIEKGRPIYFAIIEGMSEVGLPIIASTLTTIAAFLPMFIMSGTTGEFFAQIPAAVSFALLASLFECFFILPVHYLDFGPQRGIMLTKRLETDNFIVSVARVISVRILNITLKFRWLSLSAVFFLFIASVGMLIVSATGMMPLLKMKFFPDDYAIYFVDIKGPANVSLQTVDHLARDISKFVIADGPGTAESASAMAGVYMNEDYELIFGHHYGLVLVTLPPKEQQTFSDAMQHLETMRNRIKKNFEKNGFKLSVHAMKEGPPAGKAINVKILGSDIDAVTQLSDQLIVFLKTNEKMAPYLEEMEDNRGLPKKNYRFNVLHERVKEYDLDSLTVAKMAGSVIDGRYIGKFRDNDDEIDLKLKVDLSGYDSPEQVLTLPVIENSVRPVLLGDLVQLQKTEEPSEFNRYQGHRAVSIKADITPGAPISPAFVVNEVKKYYATIRDNYPGATVIFSGEYENTQRSYQSLVFAFFLAVMIIYMILAAQFQSYIQPVIILFGILFAIIGIILGKFLTQSLFTINSFIAVIGVVGVVVNDALVFVDFMNKGYRSGLTRREAIDDAVKVRLRPIILTTVTTIVGLLPMAIGFPSYSIVWGTMASTFVAGLGTATLLTLWVVPVVWDLIQERQEKK